MVVKQIRFVVAIIVWNAVAAYSILLIEWKISYSDLNFDCQN